MNQYLLIRNVQQSLHDLTLIFGLREDGRGVGAGVAHDGGAHDLGQVVHVHLVLVLVVGHALQVEDDVGQGIPIG